MKIFFQLPENRWLWLCLALHLIFGGVYLAILPLWGAVPDEPLHYSHIKFVGEFWRLPYITDPRGLGPLSEYIFTADPVGTAQHGPLYYWTSAPAFWISRGVNVENQLYLLRGVSLLWGALMLAPLWAILKRIFVDNLALAGTLLLCATLLPHRLLMSGVIYNDIGCALTLTVAFYFLSRALEDDARARAWLFAGLALGVAAITKRVALVALPAFWFGVYLQGRRAQLPMKIRVGNWGALCLGFLLVSGWWFARDLLLYNELFPTEPSIVRRSWGDLLLYASVEQLQFMFTYSLRGLWLSLWSHVGWIPWDKPGFWGALSLFLYGGFAIVSLGCAVGVFGGKRTLWRGLSPYARDWVWISLLAIIGMVYGALNWVLRYSFHNNEETGKHAIALAAPCLILLGASACFWLGQKRASLLPIALAALFLIFNIGAIGFLMTNLIPKHRQPTPVLAQTRVRDLPSGRAPSIWHRYRVPHTTQIGGEVPRPASIKPPLNFRDFPDPQNP